MVTPSGFVTMTSASKFCGRRLSCNDLWITNEAVQTSTVPFEIRVVTDGSETEMDGSGGFLLDFEQMVCLHYAYIIHLPYTVYALYHKGEDTVKR